MVPTTSGARLDDVCRKIVAAAAECLHLRSGGHHPAERRQPGPEYVGDEHDLTFLADRAAHLGGRTEIGCCPDELGMRVAHLVLAETTTPELVDEVTTRKAVVDDGAPQGRGPTQRRRTEAHAGTGY